MTSLQQAPIQYRVSDEQYAQLKDWVRNYINNYCIVRQPLPGKVYGHTYEWMFYLRRGLFNQRFLLSISQMFIYHMERLDPQMNFQITGLETAATPMLAGIPLTALVYATELNAFVVRQNRKDYGLKNMIEGVPNEKVAVIIDDLCNSGKAMGDCYWKLVAEGIPVANKAFAIVNKAKSAQDIWLPEGIEVISLFTLDDFDLGESHGEYAGGSGQDPR